jgi:hypothetical protein
LISNSSSFKINNKPIYAFLSSPFGLSLTIQKKALLPIGGEVVDILIWT